MQSVRFCTVFKAAMTLPVVLGTVCEILTVIEYLAEVLEPSAVHHGAVGKDKRAPEIHVLDHLQGGECLAETHLGVPEHLVAFPELLFRLLNGFPLFGAEHNGAAPVRHLAQQEGFLALLDGCNGTFYHIERGDKPFISLVLLVKHLPLHAGTLQYGMYLLVVERAQAATVVQRQFGVQQFVAYACGLRVLVDALPCRIVQRLAVRCQPDDAFIVTSGLAYLQATFVCGIVDAEHVYQLQFEGREVFHRHSF